MTNTIEWQIITCPICSSKNHTPWRTVRDRFDTIPGQEFPIVSCQDCGFRFLNPRPDSDSIRLFYEAEGYDPFLSTKKGFSLSDYLYTLVRQFSLWRKRLLIEDFLRAGRLMDVGCGTGEFIRYMEQYQWETAGVEKAEKAREYVESQGINVSPELEQAPRGPFDVITLWHVMEHLHEVNAAVDSLNDRLRPGGYLVLAMPNVDSYDAKRYQSTWVALDTPRHLYHFTQKDTVKLVEGNGLRLADTRNLWLDTIYNVIYSEALYHRWEGKRYRPLFLLNSIIGSYINDWQQEVRQASASVYIFQKEEEHA